MSADQLHEVLDRAMGDAVFRELLASDPASALAGYDLTDEERARFGRGSARAEPLDPRVSKSDLSAALGVRTSSVEIPPPSRSVKDER